MGRGEGGGRRHPPAHRRPWCLSTPPPHLLSSRPSLLSPNWLPAQVLARLLLQSPRVGPISLSHSPSHTLPLILPISLPIQIGYYPPRSLQGCCCSPRTASRWPFRRARPPHFPPGPFTLPPPRGLPRSAPGRRCRTTLQPPRPRKLPHRRQRHRPQAQQQTLQQARPQQRVRHQFLLLVQRPRAPQQQPQTPAAAATTPPRPASCILCSRPTASLAGSWAGAPSCSV